MVTIGIAEPSLQAVVLSGPLTYGALYWPEAESFATLPWTHAKLLFALQHVFASKAH